MIIKELRIKNFRSYYGDNNRFVFSDGLTLIIGDNGDGKTTFFEALQWLFNTTVDKGSMDHVSEMRKSKLEIGESDEVTVSMLFEHDGEKSVEKSQEKIHLRLVPLCIEALKPIILSVFLLMVKP